MIEELVIHPTGAIKERPSFLVIYKNIYFAM